MSALRLRRNVELLPSWIPGQDGLVLRDPYRYVEGARVLSRAALPVLAALDGTRTRGELLRAFPRLDLGGLLDALDEDGFLEGPRFEALRSERHAQFARAPVREPLHAGGGYPAGPDELRAVLDGYRRLAPPRDRRATRGIAAPHVSPFGAPETYGAAFAELGPELADRTFVILGTSHYGPLDKFGLTAKPFRSPLGATTPDPELVHALAARAPAATVLEDYAHAIEHSIEFQVVFLQHAVAPAVRVVPILCGPFSAAPDAPPSDDVIAFLDALEALQRSRDDLYWIVGVDLAHVGRRYGQGFAAEARRGVMCDVESTDRARLERVLAGDADGFFELAHPSEDAINWCGTTSLYAFLRAVPDARGALLRYDQWNIDPSSVVTFASLGFDA